MKKITIYTSLIILVFILSPNLIKAQKNKEQKTVKLQTSAHSENCKAKIEKTLAFEKGIVESELDRETQILTVTYKPKKTDVEKIIKVITNLGHEATEIIEPKDEKIEIKK
ncbi:MAG: cation transporter [Bacteroidetes bacterium]|nr:cation transporter [Bacteroidota bacterium]